VRAGISTVAPSDSESEFMFQLPITPKLLISEPKKKRKLAKSEIVANDAIRIA
jgi:hypothetical protein